MGAIHELREDYRFYRGANPGYRWLFLLGDLVGLLVKLALFGGFLFLCWYLLSFSPNAEQSDLVGSNVAAPATEETAAEAVPELTDERVARLREIAGNDVSPAGNQAALVGSAIQTETNPNPNVPEEVAAPDNSASSDNTALVASLDEPLTEQPANEQEAPEAPEAPEVRVEAVSATDNNESIAVVEAVQEPAVQSDDRSGVRFTDNVFIPAGTENGAWALNQRSSDHTMQLALTVNVEFLVDFAQQLPDEYTAAIYPERVNNSGNIQYSLILGSFPSKRSAEAALAELDENLKRYGAHTRVFEEVQGNVNDFVL